MNYFLYTMYAMWGATLLNLYLAFRSYIAHREYIKVTNMALDLINKSESQLEMNKRPDLNIKVIPSSSDKEDGRKDL